MTDIKELCGWLRQAGIDLAQNDAQQSMFDRSADALEAMGRERDEARELHLKTRNKPMCDGSGDKIGDMLDNQAWVMFSHVASQLADHFSEPDMVERWQDAWADGEVHKGYFTPHRGAAAWIAREVIKRTPPARQARQQGGDAAKDTGEGG